MKRFHYIMLMWLMAAMLMAQPLVQNVSVPYSITQGLQERHITLWASHGAFYNSKQDRWQWQRARLFETVEDLFTSSFTMPYLVPMLENAGAVVLQPRERDTQTEELIAEGNIRLEADSMGGKEDSLHLKVSKEGMYAVYVRYPSDKQNIPDAHLRITHDGVYTIFQLNQKMNQNSWIYLGTYHFNEGSKVSAALSNESQAEGTAVLSGLRLGGGMGSIKRGGVVSGYPRWAEAAMYYLEYDGYPTSVTHSQQTEYRDDIFARPNWVNYLHNTKHVPIDLSLALHTDAGVRKDSSIIGTLLIYSHPDQRFSKLVQDQIVNDLKKTYAPEWSRRQIMNKDYIEAKVPTMPSILIELLSHQNLADMRYGLDPRFRFDASRAMYKGLLRYMAQRKNFDYCVQPLPVKQFSARLVGDSVRLTWKGEEDPLESTARPTAYMVYTAKDKDDWDNGTLVKADTLQVWCKVPAPVDTLDSTSLWADTLSWSDEPVTTDSILVAHDSIVLDCQLMLAMEAGTHYRFRISAVNAGGVSMPSETIGAYRDHKQKGEVLVINGFTRVCAPSSFDYGKVGGFVPGDPGVPDGYDHFRTGYQYDMARESQYKEDDAPGWGASYDDWEHTYICGNTHDYAVQEGRLWAEQHYSYSSSTAAAVEGQLADTAYDAIDLVLGEQKRTPLGKKYDFDCFPKNVQQELNTYLQRKQKGLLFVSGSNVGEDLQNSKATQTWAKNTLHYTYVTNHATQTGIVWDAKGKKQLCQFEMKPNTEICSSYSPDVLGTSGGKVIMRYGTNQKTAGVAYTNGKMRIVVLGFPVTAIKSESEHKQVLKKVTE